MKEIFGYLDKHEKIKRIYVLSIHLAKHLK